MAQLRLSRLSVALESVCAVAGTRIGPAPVEPVMNYSRSLGTSSSTDASQRLSPPPSATDAQLLDATAGGDADGFDALYRRHAAVIRGRLRRRCADPELAEEVLQDTFLAVWRGAAGWRGSGEVQAWIWGIAVHRLAGALRARLSRPCLEVAPYPPAPSAEDEALGDVQYGELWAAVTRLTPELRQVVRATILFQLTTHETAGLLGIPQGTVKTRMMRARQTLRQHVGQEIDLT